MKKLFLLPILLCMCVMQALAAQWTDDNGVTWTFSQYNYNYGGSNHSYWTITAASNYGDEVVLPEIVYEGETPHTIEAIGSSVFQDKLTLSHVTLPTTIKYINSYAFSGCTALTAVDGTANSEYINWNAFSNCSSLTSIDLSNCQYIGSHCFYNCSSLTTIGSIANCSSIDNSAFSYCSSLHEVNLRDNVQIGTSAFNNCTSLTSVGSLNGATIGGSAFRYCSNLTNVDISQSVSVGSQAFQYCSNLTSVGDLSGYTAISDYVFDGCQKLEAVDLSNCRTIGKYAFQDCKKIQTVDLGEVVSIGESAFRSCLLLEEVGNISAFTTIPDYLFNNCPKLRNVLLPNVLSVGVAAFAGCKSMTEISLPLATSIGKAAFAECSSLETAYLPSCKTIADFSDYYYLGGSYRSSGGVFYQCTSLNAISLPEATSIGSYAFSYCSSLASISLPKVTSIGSSAFYGCSVLNEPSITSSDLNSVGSNAFSTPGTITLMATTPPTLGDNNAFGSLMVVRVPDASVDDYKAADKWIDFKARIVGIGAQLDYDVNVTAQTDHSGLNDAIGEANLGQVVSLKITGNINGYDIMVMRNKMDNLHYLDLSDANIVANDYEYYTGYHSEENVLGAYSFYQLNKLLSVKLPQTITQIGAYSFRECSNLKEVEFQTGLESIGSYAFYDCSNVKDLALKSGLKTIGNYAFSNWKVEEIILPDGLESIGSYSFYRNYDLKRIALPSSLKRIGDYCFEQCSSLTNVSLPTSLETIPTCAFRSCSGLTELRIPSTIVSIGNQAFSGCSKLNDVYTYIAEPTQINMNTFSTYTTATLHVPTTSYYNYWYDTEWSQFRSLENFDAEYEYFYINKDFTISDEAGTIQGEGENDPDADLNPGSGLIVETTDDQELDEVHIKVDGDQAGSIIANQNITANKVYFDITITGGKWYFLSFPFRVKISNITPPAGSSYVFRYYSGENRAGGLTGWLNWLLDYLLPGQGYIFQCNKSGTLSLCVERENMNWAAENRPHGMEQHPATNQQDASWNFLGNPHTSYYDIDKTGYTQPITVWNGSSYEAVRPGDDDYRLRPFEGFFVQKPENESEMNFPAGNPETDGRYTYRQWENSMAHRAAARRAKGVDENRLIVNLTLSDNQTTDKTRIVFNEEKSVAYEMECDAAKFMSSENVPQLYSLDPYQTKYAINERPLGEVRLGFKASKKGELTISAARMDQPVLIRDNMLQITHDFAMGDYTFNTEEGTFEDRFMIVTNSDVTSVGKLRKETGVSVLAEQGGISFSGIEGQDVNVYSVSGTTLASHVGNGFVRLPKAAYIVTIDSKSTKLIVR